LDAEVKPEFHEKGPSRYNWVTSAQYRLGVCLLAKGDTAEATKAFQAVIDNYPEQKDLVEKAREHVPGGLKLLPAPWTDGEVLELNMKLAGGMTAGQPATDDITVVVAPFVASRTISSKSADGAATTGMKMLTIVSSPFLHGLPHRHLEPQPLHPHQAHSRIGQKSAWTTQRTKATGTRKKHATIKISSTSPPIRNTATSSPR
jgi:hypothetical protein